MSRQWHSRRTLRLHPEARPLGNLPLPQIQPTFFATLYPLRTQPMTRPLATPFVIFCVCANSPPAGVQQCDTFWRYAVANKQSEEHVSMPPLWGIDYMVT